MSLILHVDICIFPSLNVKITSFVVKSFVYQWKSLLLIFVQTFQRVISAFDSTRSRSMINSNHWKETLENIEAIFCHSVILKKTNFRWFVFIWGAIWGLYKFRMQYFTMKLHSKLFNRMNWALDGFEECLSNRINDTNWVKLDIDDEALSHF